MLAVALSSKYFCLAFRSRSEFETGYDSIDAEFEGALELLLASPAETERAICLPVSEAPGERSVSYLEIFSSLWR